MATALHLKKEIIDTLRRRKVGVTRESMAVALLKKYPVFNYLPFPHFLRKTNRYVNELRFINVIKIKKKAGQTEKIFLRTLK